MPQPTPLPPLGHLFKGDDAARNAYAHLLPLEEQRGLPIRILGQMLIQAPSPAGRGFVAESINCCATEQQITELGELQLGHFVKYFKAQGSEFPSSCLSLEVIRPGSSAVTPTPHSETKKQALVRDNYRCMLTGAVEISAVESFPWLDDEVIATNTSVTNTQCCHILSEHAVHEDIQQWQDREASNPGIAARLFGGGPEYVFPNYELRSTLTIEVGVATGFNKLQIWLEPTGQIENQYIVRKRDEYIYRGRVPEVVTFSSTSPNLPLPDPHYLALHAALGRIIKLTGARGFLYRVLQEAEGTHVLSEDGSSGELLNYLLPSESVSTF